MLDVSKLRNLMGEERLGIFPLSEQLNHDISHPDAYFILFFRESAIPIGRSFQAVISHDGVRLLLNDKDGVRGVETPGEMLKGGFSTNLASYIRSAGLLHHEKIVGRALVGGGRSYFIFLIDGTARVLEVNSADSGSHYLWLLHEYFINIYTQCQKNEVER